MGWDEVQNDPNYANPLIGATEDSYASGRICVEAEAEAAI